MSKSKLAKIIKLEQQFKDLRITIIERLQKVKRNPEEPPPHIRIAGNEDRGGHSSLLLDALGKWFSRDSTGDYPIEEPSVNYLIEEYAFVANPDFRSLMIKGVSPETKKSYLKSNRLSLLRGLVQAMEKSLQNLPKET